MENLKKVLLHQHRCCDLDAGGFVIKHSHKHAFPQKLQMDNAVAGGRGNLTHRPASCFIYVCNLDCAYHSRLLSRPA